jgi:transcriptional regulator with XRE-family HTH domain
MASPIVSRYQIGRELRRLREGRGLQQSDAAQLLACDDTKITKVETGKAALTVGEVRSLLGLYQLPEAEWPPLLQLARDARRRTSHRVADYARKFAALEAEAAEIRTYEAETIPGLFQTEDYARAVTLAWDPKLRPDVVEQFVTSRFKRSKALTGDNPPLVWAVLNEGAIRRQVGGQRVMDAQLDRLLEITALPTVALHVMPFSAGAHAAMGSSFVLLGLPEPVGVRVVYLEDLTSADYLDQPREVATYSLMFDRLLSASLDTEGSKQMIYKIRHYL